MIGESYPFAFSEALARPDLSACRRTATPLDELVPLISPNVTPENSAYTLIRAAIGRALELSGACPVEMLQTIIGEGETI